MEIENACSPPAGMLNGGIGLKVGEAKSEVGKFGNSTATMFSAFALAALLETFGMTIDGHYARKKLGR